MNCKQRIGERIYWTSVNDRRKQLFENIWPLPNGVSYNSYLIRDEKCMRTGCPSRSTGVRSIT